MSEPKPRSRRLTRIFVNREFQVRMMRRAGLPLTIITTIFAILIYLYTPEKVTYTGDQLRVIGLGGLAVLFVFVWAGIHWSLWLFSSRVAGPLLALKNTLKEVAAGNLTARLTVRKRDELQEHTEHLNQTLESLQARVKRINQFCSFATREIIAMQESDPQNKNLSRMAELVESIEESLSDFQVTEKI